MSTEILEVETEEVSNELVTIVKQSGPEQTKGQRLLQMFTPYFNKMAEIETKITAINKDNPTKADVSIARAIRLSLKENRVASEKLKDSQKETIIIEGRLIDNLNNIVKNTSKSLELQCESIEKAEEIKENARKESLKIERIELLKPYTDGSSFPLETMTTDAFDQNAIWL